MYCIFVFYLSYACHDLIDDLDDGDFNSKIEWLFSYRKYEVVDLSCNTLYCIFFISCFDKNSCIMAGGFEEC